MATSTAPPSQDLKAFSEISDVFSVEHGRRSVEVAFLERLISAMEDANKAALLASGKLPKNSFDDSVEANLARMESPFFEKIARVLVDALPESKGFGRFRDKP